MMENKKADKIIITINLIAVIISFMIFYFTKNLFYVIVLEIISLISSLIYKAYDNQKKLEEHRAKEKEYTDLFIRINNYRSISKSSLLEFDLPYELRMLIENSLTNKVGYFEYIKLLNEDFSFNYKKMIIGLYFLVEEKRTDEWDKIFVDFIKESKSNSETGYLKERKTKELSCFMILLSFVLIIVIFLFPTLKEIVYG